jgi:hypothetical protein
MSFASCIPNDMRTPRNVTTSIVGFVPSGKLEGRLVDNGCQRQEGKGLRI